jgi:hypothetical protein
VLISSAWRLAHLLTLLDISAAAQKAVSVRVAAMKVTMSEPAIVGSHMQLIRSAIPEKPVALRG